MLSRPAGHPSLPGIAVAVALLVLGASVASASPYDEPMAAQAYTTPAAPATPGALATPEAALQPPAEARLAAPAPGEIGLAGQLRDKAGDMVITALNFLGVRYQRGGNDADNGFDCSGFTRQVFESSLGLVLPRRADDQAKAPGLVAVMKGELRPGDLVFFNTLRRTFSHVGIYVGDGKFVHAPRPGGEVRVEDMRLVYWAKRFTGARRAEPLAESSAGQPQTAALSAPAAAAKRRPASRAGR